VEIALSRAEENPEVVSIRLFQNAINPPPDHMASYMYTRRKESQENNYINYYGRER
jgi:hypothetical protein